MQICYELLIIFMCEIDIIQVHKFIYVVKLV